MLTLIAAILVLVSLIKFYNCQSLIDNIDQYKKKITESYCIYFTSVVFSVVASILSHNWVNIILLLTTSSCIGYLWYKQSLLLKCMSFARKIKIATHNDPEVYRLMMSLVEFNQTRPTDDQYRVFIRDNYEAIARALDKHNISFAEFLKIIGQK